MLRLMPWLMFRLILLLMLRLMPWLMFRLILLLTLWLIPRLMLRLIPRLMLQLMSRLSVYVVVILVIRTHLILNIDSRYSAVSHLMKIMTICPVLILRLMVTLVARRPERARLLCRPLAASFLNQSIPIV